MNTTTAAQRIQTTCVLSLALLVSGTTSASHMSEYTNGELSRQGHESFARDTPNCAGSHGTRVIIFDHGFRQTVPSCTDASGSVTSGHPAVRLARPLSGIPYYRSEDSIRYSF